MVKRKRKKCKECGELFMPFNSLQKVCSSECAILFSKKKRENEVELINNLIKEKKDRNKIQTYLNACKVIVHKYIRERDKGKNCISCNCQYDSTFDAGHFYPSGKFTSLKFNLDNIHGQCQKCNRYNEGEFEKYSINLPNRIGLERYDNLVKLAENSLKITKKWQREELKYIIKDIKIKLSEL